jgi:hypothetical protein
MDVIDGNPAATPATCVYTVLTGGYEKLNEQPVAHESAIPFVCFTDEPDLVSDTWQFRPLAAVFAADHSRNQRAYKLCPHRHLPEFDRSLYIDNTVLLKVAPEQIFAATDLSSGMCLPEHSFRETVLDEFLAVVDDGLDDPGRIFEQLNHYSIEAPEILSAKPLWSAIMLRNHRNPRVVEAMEIWLAHVYRYARRDQLSSRLAFSMAGLQPGVMCIDNYQSWFHSWPHAIQRNERRNWRSMPAFAPLNARLRLAEQKDAECRTRISDLEQSLLDQAREQADQARELADQARQKADQARQQADQALQQQQEQAAAREAYLAGLSRARERVLRESLDASERQRKAILASTTWRLLQPLRSLGRRFPRLARLSRPGPVVRSERNNAPLPATIDLRREAAPLEYLKVL